MPHGSLMGPLVSTAQRLWNNPLRGWQVEVVLTSAEEASLKGSLAYFRSGQPWSAQGTYVLNLDNVGAGQIKVVTRTGSTVVTPATPRPQMPLPSTAEIRPAMNVP